MNIIILPAALLIMILLISATFSSSETERQTNSTLAVDSEVPIH